MAVAVAACVWILLDLLVHGFLPLVRRAAVATADVAVRVLGRVRRLPAVVVGATLINKCATHRQL